MHQYSYSAALSCFACLASLFSNIATATPISFDANFNQFEGPNPHTLFGDSVASIGDITGDGFTEIIVGAPHDSVGNTLSGAAYVYSAGGPDGGDLFRVHSGLGPYWYMGLTVAGGKDVNGDRRNDYLMASHVAPNSIGTFTSGRVQVFSGQTGALLRDFSGYHELDYFGYSAALGDVDGDGKADIIVGAPNSRDQNGITRGRVYVFSGTSGEEIRRFTGLGINQQFGRSVTSADFNGDGKAEVVIGSYTANAVYVYSGVTGVLLYTPVQGELPGGGYPGYENTGYIVTLVGDIDGDGVEDLGSNSAFAAYAQPILFISGASGSPIMRCFRRNLVAPVSVGDYNHDGFQDVAIGEGPRFSIFAGGPSGSNRGEKLYDFFDSSPSPEVSISGLVRTKYRGQAAILVADKDGESDPYGLVNLSPAHYLPENMPNSTTAFCQSY